MKKIVVIGGGTMGNGISHVFAMSGFNVHLVDINEQAIEKALQSISKNLDRMVAKEKISEQIKQEILQRIETSFSIQDAVGDADLVVEAVPEILSIKESVLKQADSAAPKAAILATNTSSISITKLAALTTRPDRFIGMHFFNPVPVMKLVEVVRGFDTSEGTVNSIMKASEQLGKTPVEVQDSPGFVSNRVLMPMINEAIFCLHEGVGNAEQVDEVMKLGMAHPMGPLRLADFIGLDVCLDILNVLYEGFKDPKYRPCPLLVKMVHAGKLGDKAGQGFYTYPA